MCKYAAKSWNITFENPARANSSPPFTWYFQQIKISLSRFLSENISPVIFLGLSLSSCYKTRISTIPMSINSSLVFYLCRLYPKVSNFNATFKFRASFWILLFYNRKLESDAEWSTFINKANESSRRFIKVFPVREAKIVPKRRIVEPSSFAES